MRKLMLVLFLLICYPVYSIKTLYIENLGGIEQSFMKIGKKIPINTFLLNYSHFYSIDYELLYRLVELESGGNIRCVNYNKNGTRDTGLFQLNSAYLSYFTWKFNNNVKIGEFNVVHQANVACKYLLYLYEQTGSWYLAVCAYNAGLTKVRGHIIPDSTKRYALKIVGEKIIAKEANIILKYYMVYKYL